MTDRDATLRIVTPEGIVFRYALAGPVLRALAWGVDAGMIAGSAAGVSATLDKLGLINRDVAAAVATLFYAVVSVGYAMYFEWYWRGQTVGKRIVGIRVIDASGLHLQPYQVVIRNLMRYVDGLPLFYLVGGIASVISGRFQRLGDVAAHTVVVRVSEARQPDLDKIGRSKYNSLLDYPAVCSRLRQKVSAEAAGAAFGALLRRDEFDAGARAELFREMRAYFETLVDFPDEVKEQITPEQLVRNVVEVLYAGAAAREALTR
ncbi:MAG TPA: RDD family protein [Bryobacteraceae bacterium]|nr:RDD family protein [Bryobacteraceae bacterium]